MCIIYTHSFACVFMPVPSFCSLIFLFHWQDTVKRRRGELEGGMTVCFKEELKRGGRHRSVSQLPSVCPPSSQSQVFVYLGMFHLIWVISSSGVDQVQHKAQSDIGTGAVQQPRFSLSDWQTGTLRGGHGRNNE